MATRPTALMLSCLLPHSTKPVTQAGNPFIIDMIIETDGELYAKFGDSQRLRQYVDTLVLCKLLVVHHMLCLPSTLLALADGEGCLCVHRLAAYGCGVLQAFPAMQTQNCMQRISAFVKISLPGFV